MLHDVGKLILAAQLTEDYEKTITIAKKENVPLFLVEREIIGATHAQVGAYLLGLWGFKETIIETLVFHHNPSESPYKVFSVLTAVCIANMLANKYSPDRIDPGMQYYTDYLEELGMSDRLPVWREACQAKSKIMC
jgi:HD-like signal output (HDOD) protein